MYVQTLFNTRKGLSQNPDKLSNVIITDRSKSSTQSPMYNSTVDTFHTYTLDTDLKTGLQKSLRIER